MHSMLLEPLFLIDSAYTLVIFVISFLIYLKLNNYYELTAYEGLKYFKNSFIALIFSFLIIYVWKTIEIFNNFDSFFNIHSMINEELLLHSSLTISIFLSWYYYYMSFYFKDINEKNKTFYFVLKNEKLIFLFIIILGIVLTPVIRASFLSFPCFAFYLVYRKMKKSQKSLNYFLIYNLLLLFYTIDLIQLIYTIHLVEELFPIIKGKIVFINIIMYIFQIYIYLKIWNEVKN
jgi:hypothetical protein